METATEPTMAIRAVIPRISSAINLLGSERALAPCSEANMTESSYQGEERLTGSSMWDGLQTRRNALGLVDELIQLVR